MWRNYLTVGIRALAKNRTYAFINIFGLALGIAACLLILTFVRYEFSYDSWLEDADRTFQVQNFYEATPRGTEAFELQITSYPAGQALKKDFPQIEHLVYLTSPPMTITQNGEPSRVNNGIYADGNLFDVIRVPFVRGDRATALDRQGTVVLSEAEAIKHFGQADPIGKTLTITTGRLTQDYRVTGVFRDLPKNTHMVMSLVAHVDIQALFRDRQFMFTSWNSQGGQVYFRLKPGADVDDITRGLPAWEKRNIPDDVSDSDRTNPGDYQHWEMRNVRDVHLGEAQDAAEKPGSDKRTVVTFAIIALLILGMACVNFTNLATARASQRAREVALRKVLGATRAQLITQFIGESMIVAVIAMLIGLALVEITLPGLNAFLDADMTIAYFGLEGLLLPVIGLTILVGLAGGLYPAFYLSRFQPAQVLKANKSAADAQGSGRLRNLLVVAQFAISIALIICTAVVYGQTIYARTVDSGYKRDGLLQIAALSTPQAQAVGEALVQEMRNLEGVTAVGRGTIALNTGNNNITSVRRAGTSAEQQVALGIYAMDAGFIQSLGGRLIAGRNFSPSQPMDDATLPFPATPEAERALMLRGINVVISEAAVKRLGYDSPQAALGKQLLVAFSPGDTDRGNTPATIVGVVGDVRYRTVRDPLQPILYYHSTTGYSDMLVRFSGISPATMNSRAEAVWQRLVPEIPYSARLVDDIVNDMYVADEKRAQLFGMFAILAVVIGCLGLFGLAAFTAERRTKEIGIRKVLGAKTIDIVRLLVWQFTRPVLIANLIAWPIAWWVMRDWLNQFDVRIGLGPTPFLTAGLLALVIAVLTISAHAWRVARTNPVHALRYE
ncbi:putative ABC transport system permease protein [Sphingomonas zeicaulis]|uniref:ABC transporter permease n=1 Tax=Sphingomonas zeicaulis TaxID=1632740 RepID=UPI003D227537